MPRQSTEAAAPKSHATITAMGWAVHPRFSGSEGKKPFLSFLLKTAESGTHQIKVFGAAAESFRELQEDEPVSITARAKRQQIMDGDKPLLNSRDKEVWETQFVVDDEFGKLDDAADLGPPAAKETKNGGANGRAGGGRDRTPAGGRGTSGRRS